MAENDFNEIGSIFQNLPRKAIVKGTQETKEKIWNLIQNRVRDSRNVMPEKNFSAGWFGFLAMGKLKIVATTLVLILAISLGGVTKASKDSIPGDTLYTFKKAVERVEVALARDDESKVKLLTTHAKARLQEVKTLVQEKHDPEIVVKTLDDLKTTTNQVVAVSETNPTLTSHVLSLTTEEEQVLVSIQGDVQGVAKQAVEDAITASRDTLSKLGTDDGSTQGALATSPEQENISSTTTLDAIPSGKTGSTRAKEGTLESDIQLNGILKSDDVSKTADNEPTILTEPTIGF